MHGSCARPICCADTVICVRRQCSLLVTDFFRGRVITPALLLLTAFRALKRAQQFRHFTRCDRRHQPNCHRINFFDHFTIETPIFLAVGIALGVVCDVPQSTNYSRIIATTPQSNPEIQYLLPGVPGRYLLRSDCNAGQVGQLHRRFFDRSNHLFCNREKNDAGTHRLPNTAEFDTQLAFFLPRLAYNFY